MAPRRRKPESLGLKTLGMLYQLFFDLLTNPKHTWVIGVVIFFLEAVINVFIIRRISYTEIDWSTYMQQSEKFLTGERNYSNIGGDTGPCVYPAMHIYVYSIFHMLTSGGENILRAQYIFMYLYLANVAIVIGIYAKVAKLQPWTLIPMFLLSHRIHSLFVLRLFNDPIAMLLFYLCMLNLLYKNYFLSTIFFTFSLNLKMNILLFAPGFAYIYYNLLGIPRSIMHAAIFGVTTLGIGYPFLSIAPKEYILASFNFSRKFLFKWTVNWRFLSEDNFLNTDFHRLLLALHLIGLFWICYKKWISVGGYVPGSKKLDEKAIVLILCSSNFVGMMFARSLHYQFLCWYHHTLPALVFLPRKIKPAVGLLILGAIEMCWNTYPSTVFSSALLHLSHFVIFANMLVADWSISNIEKAKTE